MSQNVHGSTPPEAVSCPNGHDMWRDRRTTRQTRERCVAGRCVGGVGERRHAETQERSGVDLIRKGSNSTDWKNSSRQSSIVRQSTGCLDLDVGSSRLGSNVTLQQCVCVLRALRSVRHCRTLKLAWQTDGPMAALVRNPGRVVPLAVAGVGLRTSEGCLIQHRWSTT